VASEPSNIHFTTCQNCQNSTAKSRNEKWQYRPRSSTTRQIGCRSQQVL